jgi:glutamate carboxypeptidase
VGTLEEMPVEREGDRLRGPGVFDMKAGLVQMVHALEALRALELEPAVTPVALINSDEEIGSPESERWVRRLARRAERALVLEPALGPVGRLKTARKGTGHFEIEIVGRGSHAGLDPGAGASAIQELSHVIQALHGLTDAEAGVSVNVGEISGGVRPNVVAPRARAVVDVRVPDRERARALEEAIRSLEARTPGTRLDIRGSMGREPMERTDRNRRLWEEARRLGELLEMELEEGTSGGASDANLTSRFTATLDGLGPVGGGAHADHEFVEIDELPARTALLALLLLLPPAGGDAPEGRPGSGDA